MYGPETASTLSGATIFVSFSPIITGTLTVSPSGRFAAVVPLNERAALGSPGATLAVTSNWRRLPEGTLSEIVPAPPNVCSITPKSDPVTRTRIEPNAAGAVWAIASGTKNRRILFHIVLSYAPEFSGGRPMFSMTVVCLSRGLNLLSESEQDMMPDNMIKTATTPLSAVFFMVVTRDGIFEG
ncbi:MAG: hypothetical protein A2W19_15455 [Spirochaetes bacterium RBG_16_49_21]|nr:MAG: hypothetical protein A2W19_15455 [Spirochaetes bacterium RBG_16_49_21]